MSCSQDTQPATSSTCSPSSMLPYDWSQMHQGETASHHCFVIVTGCPSSNTLTTTPQAAYDVASLSARTGYILLGQTYYAVCSRTTPILEPDSVQQSWGLWQYCTRIHHLEIRHSPLQFPVHGTISCSHFVRLLLLTASRESWRHSYIMQLSFRNISVTVLFLKLLVAPVVPLRHLRHTNLDFYWLTDRTWSNNFYTRHSKSSLHNRQTAEVTN